MRTRLHVFAAIVALAGCGSTPVLGALPQQSGTVDLLTQANLRIDGAGANDLVAHSVAAAGDVNGDGRDDVIVGARWADHNGRNESGSAYVVFGSASPVGVDLAALGSAGFRIDGGAPNDTAGFSVAGAGDVNGDGRDDVVVGARWADNNARGNSGSAYVVFGSASPVDVDLAALGSAGFRIDGAASGDQAGFSVAGAGDVNGDGRDDVVVGAYLADHNGRGNSGSGYVVFGSASPVGVDLAALGAAGFRIDGAAAVDLAGFSVAGAGDVNGDGRDDVVVGASLADHNGRADSGSGYVVFGSASPVNVDLASLSSAGFRIDGAAGDDGAGTSATGAGDVNGDGRDDVIVGAPFADDNGRGVSGSAYVLFGSASPVNVDLASLGTGGFGIDGAAAGDEAGFSVAGAGDVNGDGRDDVIVGAAWADNNGRTNSGSAYVTFGWGSLAASYGALSGTVGEPVTPLAPTGVARTGAPSFSVSPALPAGLSLDPATGVVSGTPTAAQAATTFTVTMTDLAGSVAAPLSVTVAAAAAAAPPSEPAPPAEPVPQPAPDTRAPVFTLQVPKGLRAGPRVRVRVRCDEDCRVVSRAGGPPTTRDLRAGRWEWVTLRLAPRTAAARIGGRVGVRLAATDTAGNRSVLTRTVRTQRPAGRAR